MSDRTDSIDRHVTDVLIIGGGPAATWAALAARRHSAHVVLVDKGRCGSSGATAAVGNGVWVVPPDPQARASAVAERETLGGRLADPAWAHRVLDETWARVGELDHFGYTFPFDGDGRVYRKSLQGPEYMRRMRRVVQRNGVDVRDRHPALELLIDADGVVAGAAGVDLDTERRWEIRAGAVIVATGGCAFGSHSLGTDVDTGEGLLFAAEVGAEMSGMEFSNSYAIAPAGTSLTKTAFYSFATFYQADGSVLEGAGSEFGRSVIARSLIAGEPVYARLDRVGVDDRVHFRTTQPNFFQPFDRAGIDPFTRAFPVSLVLEGTVRGTGGIRIADEGCATSVPGLFAAGDAATRELVCGAFTGGGSHNAAWAIASGSFAGAAAARHAARLGPAGRLRPVRPAGQAGLRAGVSGATAPGAGEPTRPDVLAAVQAEVMPLERNWWRHAADLAESRVRLDAAWREVRTWTAPDRPGDAVVRLRETAAITAVARWANAAGAARTETRGMHRRSDFPDKDPAQQYRLLVGGLDEIWTAPDTDSRTAAGLATQGVA